MFSLDIPVHSLFVLSIKLARRQKGVAGVIVGSSRGHRAFAAWAKMTTGLGFDGK